MGRPALGGAFHGGAQFFLGRHGLDPQHVDAALFQGTGLFFESRNAIGIMGKRADRLENLAGGANRAADIDGAAGGIGFGAGILGGSHVDFAHPVLRIVQLQAVAVAAKGIGENDIGARVDETA